MKNYPKKVKRQLRTLAGMAYERELYHALLDLDRSFEDWRKDKISSGELSHRIHEYDVGVSRDLYKKYNYGDDDFNVAYAIAAGILKVGEVSPDAVEALDGSISYLKSLNKKGQLVVPAWVEREEDAGLEEIGSK